MVSSFPDGKKKTFPWETCNTGCDFFLGNISKVGEWVVQGKVVGKLDQPALMNHGEPQRDDPSDWLESSSSGGEDEIVEGW
jgi:hypothetical protein